MADPKVALETLVREELGLDPEELGSPWGAAIGSFFAGCVATVLVAALGAPLTSLALLFGPAEYFSLMVLGLIFAVVLAKGSVLKALTMILAGLLMSMIGSDLETGAERMSFGLPELSDGIGFVVVAMGMFGFGEILRNLEQPGSREIVQASVTGLMPTLPDLKASAGAIGRGIEDGTELLPTRSGNFQLVGNAAVAQQQQGYVPHWQSSLGP